MNKISEKYQVGLKLARLHPYRPELDTTAIFTYVNDNSDPRIPFIDDSLQNKIGHPDFLHVIRKQELPIDILQPRELSFTIRAYVKTDSADDSH